MPKEFIKREENALDYFIVKKTLTFSVAASSYLATKGSFLISKAQMINSRMKQRNELLKVNLNNFIAENLLYGLLVLESKFPSFSSIFFGLWLVFMAVLILGNGTT